MSYEILIPEECECGSTEFLVDMSEASLFMEHKAVIECASCGEDQGW